MTPQVGKSPGILTLAIMTGLVLVAIRWYWLAHYAVALPFWDQWDAEGWNLIRPYLQGQLTWHDLLAPHNEHRIVWARTAVLGLFAANGNQWDNLVEVYFNAAFFAAPLIALGWIAARARPGLVSVLLWPAIVVFGALPIAWENFLVGLQLPFDLMVLAAIGSLWLASGIPSLCRYAGAIALLIFSLGTLASGVLLAPALAYLIVLRWRLGAIRIGPAAGLLILIGVCAVAGIATIPYVAGHIPLRAHSISDFVHAFFHCASWPASLGWYAALIIWLPWSWLQWRFWISVKPSRTDLFFGALGTWTLIQCAAIAYTRGHEMVWMSSRYTAITLIQALVCVHASLRLVQDARTVGSHRYLRYGLAGSALVAIAAGLAFQTLAGYVGMVGRYAVTRIETEIVRSYLLGADATVLRNQPVLQIPYPDPQRLQMMLDEPALRNSLAAVVTDPVLAASDIGNPAVSSAVRQSGALSLAVKTLAANSGFVLCLALLAWLPTWILVLHRFRRSGRARFSGKPRPVAATRGDREPGIEIDDADNRGA